VSAIIINADDFGISRATNEAVRDLALRGTISSTSILVNMQHVEDIRGIVAAAPKLGVGLHLNLSQGSPVAGASRVPTLVGPNGEFHPARVLARRALLGQVSLAEVKLEVREQVARARELVGSRLDHWDSHQGAHRFEPVAHAILAACKESGVRGMRSHRHWFAPRGQPARALRAHVRTVGHFGVPRVVKETYYDWLTRRAANDFVLPEGLLSMSGASTAELLRQVATHGAPDVTLEIPCHPATNTEGLPQTTLLEARIEEYRVLASEEFQDAVRTGKLRLVRFQDLVDGSRKGSNHEELAAATV
jgi:predicted glycoside hydrolase/deacetylase ChbG (UPF0249 family)